MIEISIDRKIPLMNCHYALRDNKGFYFPKGFRGWGQSPNKIIHSSLAMSPHWLMSLGLSEEFIAEWVSAATLKWESLL
jgi:hypothetical protein